MPQGKPWEYDAPFDPGLVTDTAAGMEFGTDAAGGRVISQIQATRGVPAVAAGAAMAAGAAASLPASGKVLEFLSRFRHAAPVAATAGAAPAQKIVPEAQRVVDMLMRMKFENKFSDGQIIDALRQQGYSASITKQMLKALGGQ